jgi:AraC-like DNA-binding protein
LSELTDRIEPLSNIEPRTETGIEERLRSTRSFRERIVHFERWFGRVAAPKRATANFELLRAATQLINVGRGLTRVGDLTEKLGTNSKQLERAFRHGIGVTPKAFSRITRLQTVVRTIGEGADWADTAYRCGYFDQAHFINDFREFSGMTPGAFVRETNRMNELFAGTDVEFLQYGDDENPIG